MRSQFHHLAEQAAAACGHSAALTYKTSTLTYAELWSSCESVAAGLQALGLGRGERVAIYMEKRLETVSAIVGTSAAGGAFVPINPLLRPRQVGHILADCTVRVLITTPERLALLAQVLNECKSVEHVVVVDEPNAGVEGGAYPEQSSWVDLVSTSSDRRVVPTAVDTDMAAILYTSGSTGKPKGVVISHRNLIVGAESVSEYLRNNSQDVILAALPLSFDAGFSQLTTAFSSGAHVVLMNYLMPGDVVELCARHHVTGLTCVPPLWQQIAGQTWPPQVAAGLRYFANTGGRMPKSTLDRLRGIFTAAEPYLMYGLTEAFRSTYLHPAEVDRRPDSIGKAVPNAEILVVRPDGSVCSGEGEGELVHRGALVSLGYWNDPERTAARFRPVPGQDPALCATEMAVWSGDSVRRDADGFLYFVGRADEMIKTSGYRVSPTEIEEVAFDSGAIRDAVALGIADDALGQRVVLVVSPAVGSEVDVDHLRTYLRHQLPLYMVPREVIVRSQIPRSPNGKYDRTAVREELGR